MHRTPLRITKLSLDAGLKRTIQNQKLLIDTLITRAMTLEEVTKTTPIVPPLPIYPNMRKQLDPLEIPPPFNIPIQNNQIQSTITSRTKQSPTSNDNIE